MLAPLLNIGIFISYIRHLAEVTVAQRTDAHCAYLYFNYLGGAFRFDVRLQRSERPDAQT